MNNGIGSRRVRGPIFRVLPRTLAAAAFAVYFSTSVAFAELPDHEHAALPVDESLSLASALESAFWNYPETLELSAREEQANAWVNRGKSWLADRPSLTVRYRSDRWGPDNGLTEYEAGIQLPLWNWGGRAAVQGLGDAMTHESGAAGQALRWEVARLLRSTLWGIALAENNHELAERALETAARLATSVERRFELGDVAMSDVLLAQSSQLEAQTALIEATAELLDAERTYRSATGLDTRPPFQAEILSTSADVATDHPALTFANTEVIRAEANLEVVRKTLNTGASLLVGPQRERPAFGGMYDDSIGVSISVPFGGSSHRRTEISSAARLVASARSNRDLQLRELTLAMHEAAHGLNVVRQNLAAATKRMDLAERHEAMSASAYEKGEIELLDLLKVQATSIAARRQLDRLMIEEKRQTAFYN
ncbi:MAG: TolC family protein, partial [Halioglobus sp.]|nr:TolC family protein [Halioglobus sp.]